MRRAAIPLLLALAAVLLWQWRSETVRDAGPSEVASAQRPEPVPADVAPAMRPAEEAPAEVAAAPEPAADARSFDVVRVEPDGSALVAGRAEPDAPVEILSGSDVVARTRASASGEFVADFALPAGEHRLSLGETGGDTAIVSVPASPARDDLLVLAQRPGEASRVLALPAPAAPEPPAADARRAPLAVEAVEIEGRQLFVAGEAPKGATVRVYIDDQPVTETTGGAGNRFVASAAVDVATGDRRVRADQIGRDGGVEARVEVPFERPEGNRMAAVAAPAEAATGEGTAALEPSDARVIIRRGDTLWRISRDLYGRGARYTVIYLANGDQIRDPNRIYPGQVFRTPAEEGASPG